MQTGILFIANGVGPYGLPFHQMLEKNNRNRF
jgi:hypothetical protein